MTTDVEALPMQGQVRIVSVNGTALDAQLEIDGKPILNVTRVEFVIEAGTLNKAVLHIDLAAVDVGGPMRRVTYEAIEE